MTSLNASTCTKPTSPQGLPQLLQVPVPASRPPDVCCHFPRARAEAAAPTLFSQPCPELAKLPQHSSPPKALRLPHEQRGKVCPKTLPCTGPGKGAKVKAHTCSFAKSQAGAKCDFLQPQTTCLPPPTTQAEGLRVGMAVLRTEAEPLHF